MLFFFLITCTQSLLVHYYIRVVHTNITEKIEHCLLNVVLSTGWYKIRKKNISFNLFLFIEKRNKKEQCKGTQGVLNLYTSFCQSGAKI